MLKRADSVDSGGYPRTTVVDGGIGERHPAGEVLLGLDVRVAVVLMPRKVAHWLWLFVDGLIPVHAHVVADEIAGDAEQRIVPRELAAHFVACHEVHGEGNRVGLGDEEGLIGLRAQEVGALLFVGIDGRSECCQCLRREGVFNEAVTIAVELLDLRCRQERVAVSGVSGAPRKRFVERVQFHDVVSVEVWWGRRSSAALASTPRSATIE
ncbi:unannotated protein [freshwater metagenome]|uniref:Unannotated protein n=1 Tax=freshwater metagenome TaxID=449393 RepID=A0A6J6XTW5_9ZZZZ